MNQLRSKMYVIVREDMPSQWYVPQSCHAVAQYAKENLEEFMHWGNRTIVILGAPKKKDLKECAQILHETGVFHVGFHEPYKNSGLTALAFTSYEPIEAFKVLKLLA